MSFRSQDNSRFDRAWFRAHFAELLILCFALSLLFVKLGIGEYENWDESHIVYRAQIIERFGAWLDQSPYALGGLYSSSHPPLGVWIMVASRAIFGETVCATRLPAALCGVAATISLFFLLRRWCTDGVALLFSSAFVSSSVFLWYSRHAQLDSLLIATTVLSVMLLCSAVDRDSKKQAWFAGFFFGLAMLSKFGWAFYVIPFVVGYASIYKRWRLLVRFLTLGLVIGSTWYVYMAITNEYFVRSVFGWLIGLSSVKHYETGEKGSTYYLNQLVLACPFIVAAIIALIRNNRDKNGWLGMIWIVAVMIVLQLAVTKFPHFALVLLLPAFALAAMMIKEAKRLSRFEWMALTAAVVWSLSTQFRLYVRGADFNYIVPNWSIAIPLASALVVLVVMQVKMRGRSQAALTALCGLIVIVAATRVIGYPQDLYNDGAKVIASTLASRPQINELIVVHSGLPFDSLTPRLAYYTKGWTSGWAPGKSCSKLAWTSASLEGDIATNATSNSALVVERERDRFAMPIKLAIPEYASVISQLSRHYQHRDSLRSYDLFYN